MSSAYGILLRDFQSHVILTKNNMIWYTNVEDMRSGPILYSPIDEEIFVIDPELRESVEEWEK